MKFDGPNLFTQVPPRQRHSATSVEAANRDVYRFQVHGLDAMVDVEDAPMVLAHNWWPKRGRYTTYVQTKIKGKTIPLHRMLLNARPKDHTDHINGNGMDNRRCNIRLCTPAENARNARKRVDGVTSGFKGVSWHKTCKAFVAQIGGAPKAHLGSFRSEIEAAAAYDVEAMRRFGEYAVLNLPRGCPEHIQAATRPEANQPRRRGPKPKGWRDHG